MTLTMKAEALFTSFLQPSCCPEPEEVSAAIRDSLRAHGGPKGCAEAMAAEYGEHPETAADRMHWALAIAAESSGRSKS